GAETDVLAGHRLVFLSGSREPDGVTGGDAAGLYDLYPDGEKMLLNAVSYMIPVKLLDVTAPGDAIQGVPNDGDWPGAETPDLAIDDDTSTKFLHFKGELEPTGFQVTPAAGASIVTGLTLTTANDAIERDPVTFKLSGSNESIDGPYELIASGDIVDFAQADAWPRFTMNATPISFYNDVAYAHYQVLFPAVRDAGSANSMQIAEVELLGELYVDPDIAAINELYNQATLACGTGDVELYLSIFTEDAVVMTPGRPAFIGKEVLRAAMEGLFGLFDLGLPYTVDEVGVPGDWAFVRSSFQYSMTPKEGGETTTNPGKQLDILKRQADGSWNVYNECWNYGATPTAAKMAGTSWGPGLAKMAQEDDADAIYREMCDLYTLAVETGDTDLYVANYTDDGVQMPPDEPSRIGSEQIRAGIEPALALFNAECPIYPKEAVITGDWAFGRCDWSLSLTPKEGGPTTTFNGKGTDVLKRQADGSWKYYISCWNYNGPPIVEE
ncbi:MAG TPA: SgcJ/EcaC family oxidoreductase, partial [Sedimentisphaerales bacterium]|nr:SgcJ/EcaC family oxidoreductase [Sedimentisphaerales bacterium]